MRQEGREQRAAVTYAGPTGVESFVLREGDDIAFGRARDCLIRFAHFPTEDQLVPRSAGRLIATTRRVIVEAQDEPGRAALEVHSVGEPPKMVAFGEAYSPKSLGFTVIVPGTRQWKIEVAARPAQGEQVAPSGERTHTRHLDLSAVQRSVVEAYLEPMRRGRLEPATHREVAVQLNRHPNSVREVLYDVWRLMFLTDIPMPDVSDKRIAVVEAVRNHGLLE